MPVALPVPRPLALATAVALCLVALLYGVVLIADEHDRSAADRFGANTPTGTTPKGTVTAERRATKPLIRTGPATPSPLTRERCFGADSRDSTVPCVNPALRLAVHPTPAEAPDEPNGLCVPVGQRGVLLPCEFGVPIAQARQTFALIGDSHASHWRPALEGVARAKGWRGVSISRSSCPFTTATAILPGPKSEECVEWNRDTAEWLRDHPEVHTVFLGQHSGGAVVRPLSLTPEQVQVAGYLERWRTLPSSVRRIYVIRDTPRNSSNTLACVTQAIRQRKPPGPQCALPRAFAVRHDPAIDAARRVRDPRVRIIDMTRYMCSPRLCPPVIGGALVHKDTDHLTQTFVATLAPYFLRRLDAVASEGGPELW